MKSAILSGAVAAMLGCLGSVSQMSIANADVVYTYTGFPMQTQLGTAFAGEGVLFSVVTPTFLAANLNFTNSPQLSVDVPFISWMAAAGPYSRSPGGYLSLGDLHFQTDTSGLITGWRFQVFPSDSGAPAPTPGLLGLASFAPFPGHVLITPGMSNSYAGDFASASDPGYTFSELAVQSRQVNGASALPDHVLWLPMHRYPCLVPLL
jgi:hypothetical protein